MQLRFLLLSRDPDPRVGKQETVAQEEGREQSEGEGLRRAGAGRGDGGAAEAGGETGPGRAGRPVPGGRPAKRAPAWARERTPRAHGEGSGNRATRAPAN